MDKLHVVLKHVTSSFGASSSLEVDQTGFSNGWIVMVVTFVEFWSFDDDGVDGILRIPLMFCLFDA